MGGMGGVGVAGYAGQSGTLSPLACLPIKERERNVPWLADYSNRLRALPGP